MVELKVVSRVEWKDACLAVLSAELKVEQTAV